MKNNKIAFLLLVIAVSPLLVNAGAEEILAEITRKTSEPQALNAEGSDSGEVKKNEPTLREDSPILRNKKPGGPVIPDDYRPRVDRPAEKKSEARNSCGCLSSLTSWLFVKTKKKTD